MSRVPDLHGAPLPQTRPSAPMVVGIIGLIFVALGVVGLVVTLLVDTAAMVPDLPEEIQPGPMALVVNVVQIAILAASSIGLLLYKRFGRTLFYVYVGMSFLGIAIGIAAAMDMMSAIDDGSMDSRAAAAGMWGGMIGGAIGGLLFPLLGAFFLSRPAVGKALN